MAPENALLVGPVPAAVSVVGVGVGAFPLLVAPAAVVADLVAVERVYGLDRRTAAVVAVVPAAVGGALLALVASGPPGVDPLTGAVAPSRSA